jgi:hypothetical protein
MRALEEIVKANARAAGREAGHADNDGDDWLVAAIHAADDKHDDKDNDFLLGFLRGRQED